MVLIVLRDPSGNLVPGDQGASTGLARTLLAVRGFVAGCGANNALAELTPAAATARDRSWTMLARRGVVQPKLQLSCRGT